MDLRPLCGTAFGKNFGAKLRAGCDGISVPIVKPRGNRIANSSRCGRHVAGADADCHWPGAVNRHRDERSFGGSISDACEPASRTRVGRNTSVRGGRVCRCEHDLALANVIDTVVATLVDDEKRILVCRFDEVGRYRRRYDTNRRTRSQQRERLPRSNPAAADYERKDLLAIERNGQRAQRNCPRSNVRARKTT